MNESLKKNVNQQSKPEDVTDNKSKQSLFSPNEVSLAITKSESISGKSEVSRGNWGNKWEFLLSCIGISVGLGNVWRFPYLAYENGGGAFLVPYIIVLFLVGKPLYFMELCFGQYGGKSSLAVWCSVPIAKGVGFGLLALSVIICIYYNVIMSYTIYYIAATFQSILPWTNCNASWANGTSCMTRSDSKNLTRNDTETPNQVYWERYVLDTTDSLSDLGSIKWDLCLCLLLSWIIIALCVIKGIKSLGKVIYICATLPYVIFTILLVCGLMQEGAVDGILYFITPKWESLLDIHVWQAAAGQMFFSLGVSSGALISFSSYNHFHNNVFRDAIIVSIMDTLTSILAGFIIFSVLGAMSHDLGIPISEVVAKGPGLAFIVYPEALSPLPVPQLWTFLFFLMLFILGLDSEFGLLGNILTCLGDEFKVVQRHKSISCIIVCCCAFLLGLPCVTRGGQYVVNLMDVYGGQISIVFLAIFESIAIAWIYGIKRFSEDIETMLGRKPGWYWKITWVVMCPVVLTFVFLYSYITIEPLHEVDSAYESWADKLAWCIAAFPMIQVPLWGIIMVIRQKGPSLYEKFQQSITPMEEWRSNDPTYTKKDKLNDTSCSTRF